MNWMTKALAVACSGIFTALPASAAYINIDDSDVNTITITAGDFEQGFSVNGNLLTSGLGNSGSLTLADGGFNISGSWIDLGGSNGARVDLLFALLGNPGFTTSGIEFGSTSDGQFGSLSGSFGGYFDPSLYFFTGLPTLEQNGQIGYSSMAFLSVSFVSEAVPEPGSLALAGIAVAGLAALRRKTPAA